MAKIELKLTADQFGALDESLKQFYTATQDGGYELEGIGGLQRALSTERKTKSELEAEIAELKKFKTDTEAANSAAEDRKLAEAGEFDKWKEKLIADRDTQIAEVAKKYDLAMGAMKQERLRNELTALGVLPDRADFALGALINNIDLEPTDSGFALKVKNGLGEANDFEKLVEGLKAKSPFLFKADVAAGSGASGSNGNGGNAKTLTRAAFDALAPTARMAHIKSGGAVTD